MIIYYEDNSRLSTSAPPSMEFVTEKVKTTNATIDLLLVKLIRNATRLAKR